MIAVPIPPPPPPWILISIVSPSTLKVLPAPIKFKVFAVPTLSPAELIPTYDACPPVLTFNEPVTVKLP